MTDAGNKETTRAWRYPPRSEHPDAEIYVHQEWCKACGICYELCPAKVLTCDKAGYPIVSNPEACKSCYLCEALCPEMAITVYRERGGKRDSTRAASEAEGGSTPASSDAEGTTESTGGDDD